MSNQNLARLLWQCRRGMLELDEILQKFFNENYLKLTEKDQNSFSKLLECTDQELYYWLLGYQLPDDDQLQTIVKKIRFAGK
jgi:antitoxin CptB